jgi:hypothetical protein
MPLTIDADTFLTTVAEIVAERGEDFVYKKMQSSITTSQCSYVKSGNTVSVRCLIGEVAHRHGVSDSELSVWDRAGDVQGIYEAGYLPDLRLDAFELMRRAQNLQDNGESYGNIILWLLSLRRSQLA